MTLYGQNDLYFSYKCRDKALSPFKAKILLKSPDNEIFNLITDTISNFVFSGKNYFKSIGNYTLLITYSTENYGNDSIDYDFDISGTEIKTDISIEFDYKERLIKKGGIFIKGEKVINGYIKVNKYYNAPKLIDNAIDNEYLGDEYFKDPIFKIKNYSEDTLSGEYLLGNFWGTLYYKKHDSTLFTKIGTLDYMFVESPATALYPDSIKYVTAILFRLTKNLVPIETRFENMLANKSQSGGISVYKELNHIKWWAGTQNYYKLKYYLEVDK